MDDIEGRLLQPLVGSLHVDELDRHLPFGPTNVGAKSASVRSLPAAARVT